MMSGSEESAPRIPALHIETRRALVADADDVIQLVDEYYREIDVTLREDHAALRLYVTDPDKAAWIARAGSTPVGCVLLRSLTHIPGAGEVKRLWVRPPFRGTGVAHRLMQSLEADARAQKMSWLYLDTKDDLLPAIRLYEKLGYVRCARYNENPQATLFMKKTLDASDLSVGLMQSGEEADFRALNEQWIRAEFVMEKKDQETLADPVGMIVAPGGSIFMARRLGKAVGCCAIMVTPQGFELAKMAVAPEERGKGIGHTLMRAALDWCRAQGIRRVYLETNSKLKPAIHLYEAFGFRCVTDSNHAPSPYFRSDVVMELWLE